MSEILTKIMQPRVYNDGQLSNPILDTPNEHSTSLQPRNKRNSRTEEVLSYSTETEETMIIKQDIPNSTQEALQEQQWRQAMEEGLHFLNQNNVWTLVSLPKGKKAKGSRWHFTVKYGPDGEIKRYKARFVTKGFSHRERVE